MSDFALALAGIALAALIGGLVAMVTPRERPRRPSLVLWALVVTMVLAAAAAVAVDRRGAGAAGAAGAASATPSPSPGPRVLLVLGAAELPLALPSSTLPPATPTPAGTASPGAAARANLEAFARAGPLARFAGRTVRFARRCARWTVPATAVESVRCYYDDYQAVFLRFPDAGTRDACRQRFDAVLPRTAWRSGGDRPRRQGVLLKGEGRTPDGILPVVYWDLDCSPVSAVLVGRYAAVPDVGGTLEFWRRRASDGTARCGAPDTP